MLLGAAAAEEGDADCAIPRDATRAEKCAYVSANEACELDSLLNYLDAYYCSDVSQGAAYVILGALCLWWCLLIAALGSTADEYFCPPLTATASWLRLRPRVAAVTLLALANGAPDIFSVQAALAQGETLLALGAMFGGTLFVTCLVVPAVIWCAQEPVLAGGMLFRDVLTFCVVVGLVAGLCALGRVYFWQPAALLVLYIVYVAAVATSHRVSPVRWGRGEGKEGLLPAPVTRRDSVNTVAPAPAAEGTAGGAQRPQDDFIGQLYDMTEWASRSNLERALYVAESPFRLARSLTIPSFVPLSAGEEGASSALATNAQRAGICLSVLGFPLLLCFWVQREVLGDDDFERTALGPLPLAALVALVSAPFALTVRDFD